MLFKGWPAEAIEFYEGLEADNSKSYWTENKQVYEEMVKAPMDALLAELASEFGPGRVFRPYRDVRFSKDKSPYKTNVAATIGDLGYVTFSAQGLGCGSGMWMMMPDQLDRFRTAVDADRTGKELEAIVNVVRRKHFEIGGHESLKTAPKGYAKDHPRIEFLRAKGFVTWTQWEVGAWLGTKAPKKRIVDFLHASQPLNDWLAKQVGPSTMPVDERRRA